MSQSLSRARLFTLACIPTVVPWAFLSYAPAGLALSQGELLLMLDCRAPARFKQAQSVWMGLCIGGEVHVCFERAAALQDALVFRAVCVQSAWMNPPADSQVMAQRLWIPGTAPAPAARGKSAGGSVGNEVPPPPPAALRAAMRLCRAPEAQEISQSALDVPASSGNEAPLTRREVLELLEQHERRLLEHLRCLGS